MNICVISAHYYWSHRKITSEFLKYAREAGWMVRIFAGCPDAPPAETIPEIRPNAVVINTPAVTNATAAALVRLKCPIIGCDFMERADTPIRFAARITCDNESIARAAAGHFSVRGFKSFAYIHATEPFIWSRERGAGFRRLTEGAGTHWAEFKPPRNLRANSAQLEKWLRELPKPCALLVCNDFHATYVLDACRNAGVAVPGEIALMGVDNDEEICEFQRPTLSSVAVDYATTGRLLGEVVSALVRRRRPVKTEIKGGGAHVVERLSSQDVSGSTRIIALARERIRSNTGALSVAGLARELGISTRHLNQRFSETLHTTVKEEMLKAAIDRAKALLRTTVPIGQIPMLCGYRNEFHFKTMFKKHTGETMRAFRQSLTR